MTKTVKRVLLATLVALMFVSIALLAVACDTTFTVTVINDATKGTVTLDPQKDAYESGEKVTVTIVSNSAYEVDTAKVNGTAVLVDENGAFTFAVYIDTTVEVTYKELPSEHTVTLNVGAHGSATLEPAAENNVYAHGAEIAVKVTPDNGYAATVVINGQTYTTGSESQYPVTVNADTTIDVTFSAITISEEALASLVGNVRFSGIAYYYTYDYYWGQEYEEYTYVTTIFDEEKSLLWQYEENQYGAVYSNYLFGNVDGEFSMFYHTLDGKLQVVQSGEDFYKYFNQFGYLTVEDFEFVSAGVWQITDADLASLVAAAITGYEEYIDQFLLYEENGKITQIVFSTPEIEVAEYYVIYQNAYAFEVAEDSVSADWAAEYQLVAEHADLQAALNEAASATSYKIHYLEHVDGYTDFEYDQYIDVTNSLTYNNYAGDEFDFVTGYLMYEGSVWAYNYANGKANITDTYEGEFADFIPLFDFNVAPLESLGDGVFRLRAVDRMSEGIAAVLGSYFGVGIEQQSLYYYAYDIQITLAYGKLSEVVLAYYDTDYDIVGSITLTFSDWNETEIPVDIDEIVYVPFLLPSDFNGTWYTQVGDPLGQLEMVIGDEGVTINGETCKAGQDYQGWYTVTWKGTEYIIMFDMGTDDVVYLQDSSYNEIYFIRKGAKSLTSPFGDECIGTFIDESGSHVLEIKDNGAILVDGSECFIFYISSSGNTAYVVLNGQWHYFDKYGASTISMDGYFNDDGIIFKMETDGTFPTMYQGTYEGTNADPTTGAVPEGEELHTYKVIITATAVLVFIDGESQQVENITYDDFEGFTFYIDGIEYYIFQSKFDGSSNVPQVALADEFYYLGGLYVRLDRVED